MKKGISIAITTLILLALAVAVIFFSITYFNNQTGSVDKISEKRYIMECCQKWLYDNCNPNDITMTPTGATCSLPGCSDFANVAIKYGFKNTQGGIDLDALKDFCGCPQGG